jgi:hypothetical protein
MKNEKRWLDQHVFNGWDKIIAQCETYLHNKVPSLLFFDKTVVRERLVQLLESEGFLPFSCLCLQRLKSGEDPFPLPEQILPIGGLAICPDGRVQLSLRFTVRGLVKFIFIWLHLFKDILLGILPHRGKDSTPVTILFGLGIKPLLYQETDVRFVRFCREGRIKPLSETQKLLIETSERKGSISDPSFVYVRNPIGALVRDSHLGVGGGIRLLLAHLSNFFRFLVSVIRFPLLSMLASDVAYASAVRALDQRGLIETVVITNSSVSSQPLWMRGPFSRGFRVHEIHYSQNSKPFVYVHSPMEADYPALRHVRVDEHWVWTPGFKAYLEELGHRGPIHVVGPIVFSLPEPLPFPSRDEVNIAIFDVTPACSEMADRLGVINYYYRTENMLRFIKEIVCACGKLESKLGRPIRILLKPKRGYTKGFHDQRYIDFINGLIESSKKFELVPYDKSLFSLLGDSDLSISIPYTSVAYISSSLGKPAIYFDPTYSLLPTFEQTPYIEFASGKTELLQTIERIISGVSSVPIDSGFGARIVQ